MTFLLLGTELVYVKYFCSSCALAAERCSVTEWSGHKPYSWAEEHTGHPLVDKREVALPTLSSTLGYKLECRRLSVFIYLFYFSYT
jgi:hypothetical protein